MHLEDAESDLLKSWVVKRLEDISDADSDVLADYVLALVKSDEPDDQVKQNCQENLEDFLKEHTAPFVNDVFGAIASKSYDPSRPQQKPLVPTAPAFQPSGSSDGRQSFGNGNGTGNANANANGHGFSNDMNQQSRKRTFNDWEGAEGNNGQGSYPGRGGDRPVKQMRRGGRGGFDQRGGRSSQATMPNQRGQAGLQLPQMPTPPPGMPPFDPNNPMATLLAMQAMGLPALPGMPSLPGLPPRRHGERCKDYDTKGFCALGASCPYEHGNDHLVAPEPYDPANSAMSAPHQQPRNERGRGRGRGRGERGSFRGGRGGRADFSMAGPNQDRSITSIVVEQIPEDKFNEEAVRDFFSEFGTIEEVTLQPYKRLAIVKYDSWDGAEQAYKSPKVIFDNRFVKVYWYKPDKLPRPPNGHHDGADSAQGEDVQMRDEEEKIDPAEIAKRQEEAQRAHEEKMKKVKEAEAQRLELEQKMKAHAEERMKLMAKLEANSRAKSGTPDTSMSMTDASNGESNPKPPSQTDALKAKLAELENEAKSIGINPNEDAQSWQGFPPRGRGGFRGRGTYAPRGAWRGRGGFAPPRGGAVMRLDNRPKSVAVVFPNGDEMGLEKDEALRQYLLFNNLMESAEVSNHPDRKDAAIVAFKERYLAEKFITLPADVPHIGKVELSWAQNQNPASQALAAAGGDTPTFGSSSNDTKMDDVGQSTVAEVDYDVADDDDRWLVD